MDELGTEPESSGLSRRDVFRAGVAAAAAVAGASLLAVGARPALAGPKLGRGILASNFRVSVGGTELEFPTEVEIAPIRTNVTVTPGRPPALLFEGFVPTTTIRIEVVADRDPLLAAWYDSVKGGTKSDLRDVQVDLLSSNFKDVVRTYRASDCALEAFVPGSTGDKGGGRDVYVVRCAVGGGAFHVEDF